MIYRGIGILVAGQPYVDVQRACRDIVECYISKGRVNYMMAHVSAQQFGALRQVEGVPSAYMSIGNRMHIWPTPDKSYAISMTWNADPLWPDGWYAGYKEALAAVLAVLT